MLLLAKPAAPLQWDGTNFCMLFLQVMSTAWQVIAAQELSMLSPLQVLQQYLQPCSQPCRTMQVCKCQQLLLNNENLILVGTTLVKGKAQVLIKGTHQIQHGCLLRAQQAGSRAVQYSPQWQRQGDSARPADACQSLPQPWQVHQTLHSKPWLVESSCRASSNANGYRGATLHTSLSSHTRALTFHRLQF